MEDISRDAEKNVLRRKAFDYHFILKKGISINSKNKNKMEFNSLITFIRACLLWSIYQKMLN